MAKPWEQTYESTDTAGKPWEQKYESVPVDTLKSPQMGIAPASQPTTLGGRISQWAGDASDDIKLGTDRTLIGKGLRMVGARPLNEGVSEKTADYMGSPVLGTLRATKGIGEVAQPEKRWEGIKNIGGGILDAAQMPLSMFPEGSTRTIEQGFNGIKGLLPSTERAGRNFQTVMSRAKDIPVDLAAASDPALRAHELREAGASMPSVVNKFLQRTTGPGIKPLTYGDARTFASNAGRLSADENSRMIPPMRREVSRLTQALNDANASAADKAGVGPLYNDAMREYRRAAQLRDAKDATMRFIKGPGAKAALGGSAGYGAYRLLHGLGE